MNEHRIMRLGHRGDGIAEGPVYAPRTLPGEIVTGESERDRIEKPRVLSASPDRVRAPCAHYNSCGGCQLMHASDAFVARWKQQVVEDALAAQGVTAQVAHIATSPPRSRRRATLVGRRLKSGPLVGFHAARSDAVTAIPNCRVLSLAILAAIPALEEITMLAGSRRGSLSFALTDTETGLDCAVTGGKALDQTLAQDLARYSAQFARLTWGGALVFMDRAPRIGLGPADVHMPPGAFLQATEAGQDALTKLVVGLTKRARHVADLFSGCGTFTFPIGTQAAVHAVEGDASLLAALDAAARNTPGLKPITTEARDLFRRPLSADELLRFDAVVIDPPRTGAVAQTAELARAQVPRIAMVSCNPVTFARDVRLLTQAGYVIDEIRLIDQFRWSTHVELAAALRLSHIHFA